MGGDPQVLYVSLTKMKDKNMQIEKSLSSETKIKMDLFSALGEAKREISIKTQELAMKNGENAELKQKIAEILAVMPQSSNSDRGRGSKKGSGLNGTSSPDNLSSNAVSSAGGLF